MSPLLQTRPSTANVEHVVDSGPPTHNETGTSRVDIERELQQVLALIALAEHMQQLERTSRFRATLLMASGGLLLMLGVMFLFQDLGRGVDTTSVVVLSVLLLVAVGLQAPLLRVYLEANKLRRAAAEIGETIREVVTTTDWKAKLEPLEWAHLRIRITQLELFDLSSLR